MRFKSIEIIGFKSFADRTKITFQPGITAIVGPNGCGKSNVSDAIRWVLGEQSAKQIRGERMEDVIFNGTNSRTSMGMAEVTLVITDLGGAMTSDFSAFNEIQITRRFYRSGESEYLINRIPCRLMDIRELFMDTGMGAKAYSIIGQGNIAAILNAKPKERRFLFEEAAGITKYKARKDEALRKLERTKDNLSRIRDIIVEVTRQRNSLNRQAKKAERYNTYRKEIQDIDLHLSSLEYLSMRDDWNRLEGEYRAGKNRETELVSLIAAKETEIEELELSVLDREKSLAELQDEVRRMDAGITREENRVEILMGEISHFNDLTEGSHREIQRLEEEIAKSHAAAESFQQELNAIQATCTEKTEALGRNEQSLEGLIGNLQEEEANLETQKATLAQLMRQIGIQNNRIENMAREKDSLLELHTGYDTNHAELVNQLSQTRTLLEEKTGRLNHAKASIEQARSERRTVVSDLEQKQEQLNALQDHISHLREQVGQESSRLATLSELKENLDGYDEGIRSLVKHAADHPGTDLLPPFHTLVAEIFETAPEHEVAIESAISHRFQSLVVNGAEDSLRAVEFLKQQEMGRGAFIPLQPKNRPLEPFQYRAETGTIGEALGLVRYDPQYAGVAEYLLGDVVVMESLQEAMALFRSNGFHRTLVTLHGDLIDPSGVLEGGARKRNTSGFIRRRREIRELEISLDLLKEQLRQAVDSREELNRDISQVKQQASEISDRLQELDAHRIDLEKEDTSLNREVTHLGQKIDGLSHENESRSTEILSLEESLSASRHELIQAERAHEEQEGRISSLTQRVGALRDRIETQRAAMTEERVQIASLKEKQTSLVSHMEENRKNVGHLDELIRARGREIEEAKARILSCEAQKKKTESSIRSLIDSKESIQAQVTQEQEVFEADRNRLREAQKEFKEFRVENESLSRKVNDLEVRRTELNIKMEHLVRRISEKYQTSLTEVLPRYQDSGIERETAEERLSELNRKIEQMGPVNIMAIEEYNALQERFEFLTTQEADLQESVESLMTAIRKINRTSRQRFQDSFDEINQKFQAVFADLFEGGHAELKLEEGEDILDAGVEIVAQPPGKKLQHLSLLSGGESALTAVALILAGFLVKPSPFCLLDEVDAPLDDANVEKYNLMLRRLTQNTQFIVITHNKNTMQFTDALYGITMQEPGISKMVSVLFHDAHEQKMTA